MLFWWEILIFFFVMRREWRLHVNLGTSICTLFQSFTSLKDTTIFTHIKVFVFLSIFSIFLYTSLCYPNVSWPMFFSMNFYLSHSTVICNDFTILLLSVISSFLQKKKKSNQIISRLSVSGGPVQRDCMKRADQFWCLMFERMYSEPPSWLSPFLCSVTVLFGSDQRLALMAVWNLMYLIFFSIQFWE